MTKQPEKKEDPGLASMLGAGYAHVQHVMDRAIAWGFKRMEETKATEPPAKDAGVLGKAEQVGRGILSFFGSAGNAYFDTYEKLKAKERKAGTPEDEASA